MNVFPTFFPQNSDFTGYMQIIVFLWFYKVYKGLLLQFL